MEKLKIKNHHFLFFSLSPFLTLIQVYIGSKVYTYINAKIRVSRFSLASLFKISLWRRIEIENRKQQEKNKKRKSLALMQLIKLVKESK